MLDGKGEEDELAGEGSLVLGLGRAGLLHNGRRVAFELPEYAADSGHGILKVGSGVPLHGQELVPGENVVEGPVLGKIGVLDGADSDDAGPALSFRGLEAGVLLLHHDQGPPDGLGQEVGKLDGLAVPRLDGLVVLSQDGSEPNVG